MKNDDIYANRMNPIIPGKFAGLVWLVMLVASLIRNVVPIVTGFYGADSAAEITLAVIDAVLFDGVVPMLVCYVFATILATMSLRRRVMCCRRADFVYICMLFTSVAYILMGIIESFYFINSRVIAYTDMLLNMTLLTGAYCTMFFAVFSRRMNPRERYVNFVNWSSLYLGLQGIMTFVTALTFIVLSTNPELSASVNEYLAAYYGVNIVLDGQDYYIASIIALCLLGAWIVASIAVSAVLRKKAKEFVPPAPPSSTPPGGGSPFPDFGNDSGADSSGGNDKVFEEFDL